MAYLPSEKYKKWYKVESHEVAKALYGTVSRICRQNSSRRRDDELFMRMFGSYDVAGKGESLPEYANEKSLRFNLLRSAALTAQAHIGSLKPKTRVQTTDADWSLVRRAKANEMVIKGVMDENDYHGLSTEAFLDAAVSSIGGIKVFEEDEQIKLERVFPGEILVDVKEGYYGKPRNIYQVKLVDRDTLLENFPNKSHYIDTSGSGDLGLFSWLDYDSKENQVLTIEAWHIGKYDSKSGKCKGGKHVLSVQDGTLLEEEWTRPNFPIAFYRWEKRQCGFYGRGIVEQLRTHQRTINYIDVRIRDMMHWLSRGKLAVWDNDKATVNVEHLTNAPWDIMRIKGSANPPTVLAQNAVPSEWWGWREQTIQNGYDEIGLNQMQAQGQKPPGIEAAAALREVQEAGAKRFRPKVQAFERFCIDTSKLIIQELQDMVDRGKNPTIRVKKKRGAKTFFESIDWKKVAMADEEYRLDLTPASSLPDTTAGRKDTVYDWYQAGFITTQEARALLEFPDLERFDSLDLSAHEVILEAIETIIEDGEYVFPEPTDDLRLLVKLATQSYNKFRLRKAPEEHLELLRRYIDDAKHLIEMSQQPQQQQAAQVAETTAGIQRALPGGANPQQTAALLQATG